MRIDLFDYDLPEELIAQEPAARRDASRLLVVDRGVDGDPVEHRFAELPSLLRAGDLLVVNDAHVEPARLHTRRPSGGAVEVLLVRKVAPTGDGEVADEPSAGAGGGAGEDRTGAGGGAGEDRAGAGSGAGEDPSGAGGSVWEALVRPGRRVRPGDKLLLGDGEVELEVRGDAPEGRRLIALPAGTGVRELLDAWGEMPLPPYIQRVAHDARAPLDRQRYQTVYARHPGAVAAPTAGLHFTDEVLAALAASGIERTALNLSVGPGTFQPVRVDEVSEHRMEAERYTLPPECVDAICAARARGGRVVGVGTTVVRTLEHAARENGDIEHAAGRGSADIFIYPGFEFRVIDAMLTNFHLPRSTPILMAAALAGRERLLRAYRYAVSERFRFYSYGDAMLIL